MFTEKFDKDAYNITEKFMSAKKSNLLSMAILLPFYIIGVAVYVLKWDYVNIFATLFEYYYTFLLELLILALGVFAFIAVAMIIKSVLFSVFAEGKFSSVRFKIINETQKPYCCLKEPIKVRQYQLCLAVYILIAAVAPYIAALLIGDFIYIIASFLCAFFAGSDILFFIILFNWKSGAYVIDFDGVMLYRVYEKI